MKKAIIGAIVIVTVVIGVSGGLTAYFLLTNELSEFQDFELGLGNRQRCAHGSK